MKNPKECVAVERFLEAADEDSFDDLFRIFLPRLVAFFRRRGHHTDAEDLAQEVMFTVFRKARQLRDRNLFRPWLYKLARNAAIRYLLRCSRRVPTIDLTDVLTVLPGNSPNPASEFNDWMKFLNRQEQETMKLRFVEHWEYHEIAAAQAVPIGTVQWRVFNSKNKLAPHLRSVRTTIRKAA